jgi:anti-anti-sigma factor
MDFSAEEAAFNRKYPSSPVGLSEDRLGMVVSISGSLELEISYDLQKLLMRIIDESDSGIRIAFDLSEVGYISSTGVGALINTLVEARKRGVGIIFRNIPPKVFSVLNVLGLSGFFPCEEDEN